MIAAVGAAKLYHISATACIDADLPASLKALMLSDPDAQVNYPAAKYHYLLLISYSAHCHKLTVQLINCHLK